MLYICVVHMKFSFIKVVSFEICIIGGDAGYDLGHSCSLCK